MVCSEWYLYGENESLDSCVFYRHVRIRAPVGYLRLESKKEQVF